MTRWLVWFLMYILRILPSACHRFDLIQHTWKDVMTHKLWLITRHSLLSFYCVEAILIALYLSMRISYMHRSRMQVYTHSLLYIICDYAYSLVSHHLRNQVAHLRSILLPAPGFKRCGGMRHAHVSSVRCIPICCVAVRYLHCIRRAKKSHV